MLTMGAVLIDGARVRSAKVIVQEAADIAAMSVLSNYNTLLKDEFGLFALKDSSSAPAKFESYLKASMNAYGGTDVDSYSGMVQNLLQKSIFGGGDYRDKDFINLYNFDVSSNNVEMLYDLADMDVLESQIAEYSKFRGIIPVMQRLPILSQAGQIKDDIEKAKNAMNVMNEKIAIDENEGADAEKYIGQIIEAVDKYNGSGDGSINKLKSLETGYYTALSAYLTDLKDDGSAGSTKITNYTNAKNDLTGQLDKVKETFTGIRTVCSSLINSLGRAIPKYEALRDKYRSYPAGSTEKTVSDDCGDTVTTYANCKAEAERLLAALNSVDVVNVISKAKENIGTVDTKINNAISSYETAKNERSGGDGEDESEDVEFKFIKTNNGETTDKNAAYNDYRDKIHNEINKLKDSYSFNNPISVQDNHGFTEDSAKSIGDSANSKKAEKKDESNKVNLTDEEYEVLPSQNRDTTTYEYDDMQLDRDNGVDTVNSVSETLGSFMTNFISSSMNDLLVYSYILGTFKTRITGNENIKYNEPPANPLKNYHTKWRYGDKPISDLRGNPIAERVTKFKNAEVEYIFSGNKSEAANEATVYAWIYATRMANNLIAIYTAKPGANTECFGAATAAAAACGFVVPVSVFHWIFMIAWAAGETALEMSMLIDKGYSVPLLKTKDSLYIEHIWNIAEMMDGGVDGLADNTPGDAILLSYEDYLVIMLAFVGADTRLVRTADLIQLNMGKLGQGDFRMDSAYTYFKTSSNIGIKYLFQGVSQFGWGYSGAGIGFTNTIYKGY
jgi:hypothetical protein